MPRANYLALKANVPVWVEFLVGVDLHATLHVANGERKQVGKRQSQQLDFVAWCKDDFLSQHFQIERHWGSGVVSELSDANVLARVHVHT
jgi:hypothetical protein